MLRQLVEFLMSLKPERHNEGARVFYSTEMYEIHEPGIEPLKTTNLDSIVQYIKNFYKVEKISENLLVEVRTPTEVRLYTKLTDGTKVRHCLLKSEFEPPKFITGRFLEQKEFIIMLKSCFVPSPDRDRLIQVSGKTVDIDSTTRHDNGFGQTVQVENGLNIERENLPEVLSLAPFRTFPEADQPKSLFIPRAEKGGRFAIFEADGGAWKNQAMTNIREYLTTSLADFTETKVTIIG